MFVHPTEGPSIWACTATALYTFGTATLASAAEPLGTPLTLPSLGTAMGEFVFTDSATLWVGDNVAGIFLYTAAGPSATSAAMSTAAWTLTAGYPIQPAGGSAGVKALTVRQEGSPAASPVLYVTSDQPSGNALYRYAVATSTWTLLATAPTNTMFRAVFALVVPAAVSASPAATPSASFGASATGTASPVATPSSTRSVAASPASSPAPPQPLNVVANVQVVRIGDGSIPMSSAAMPLYVDSFAIAASGAVSPLATIPLPQVMSGANLPCTQSGSAGQDGYATASADGAYIQLGCYGSPVGTLSVTSSASPRVFARVGQNGVVDTTTGLTDAAVLGQNWRTIVSTNGLGPYWGFGKTDLRYWTALGANTSVAVNTAVNFNYGERGEGREETTRLIATLHRFNRMQVIINSHSTRSLTPSPSPSSPQASCSSTPPRAPPSGRARPPRCTRSAPPRWPAPRSRWAPPSPSPRWAPPWGSSCLPTPPRCGWATTWPAFSCTRLRARPPPPPPCPPRRGR